MRCPFVFYRREIRALALALRVSTSQCQVIAALKMTAERAMVVSVGATLAVDRIIRAVYRREKRVAEDACSCNFALIFI